MGIDLSNESHDETQLIEPGIYRVQAEIIPGGFGKGDLLKKSKKGTLAYLNVLNRVISDGPYKDWGIYDMIIVEPVGAKPTDGEQQITKRGRSRVRRIVESARCVDVDHEPVEKIRELLAINDWG